VVAADVVDAGLFLAVVLAARRVLFLRTAVVFLRGVARLRPVAFFVWRVAVLRRAVVFVAVPCLVARFCVAFFANRTSLTDMMHARCRDDNRLGTGAGRRIPERLREAMVIP
jgi:hypothetical protein